MITYELYMMCIKYLAWYDDIITYGQGIYLSFSDIKMAQCAEEIINLYRAEEIQVI